MLSTISQHLRQKLKLFPLTDNLILNNKVIPVSLDNFQELNVSNEEKTLAFVDGGQAEILSGGNLCLSFLRVFAQVMRGGKKISSQKREFYLLTTAIYRQGEIWYESRVFPEEKILDKEDLVISSYDASVKSGQERGLISRVAGIARRFAELKLASEIKADYVLLDGTLEPTFQKEEKYLNSLGKNVSTLAKTCSLFTTCGNSPVVLLQRLSPYQEGWSYFAGGTTYFVKLHPRARHVFRFEGNESILPFLLKNSADPLFLGYPYGLILADRMGRISQAEKNSLRASFLLRAENKEIAEYLNTLNAHEILDRLG